MILLILVYFNIGLFFDLVGKRVIKIVMFVLLLRVIIFSREMLVYFEKYLESFINL